MKIAVGIIVAVAVLGGVIFAATKSDSKDGSAGTTAAVKTATPASNNDTANQTPAADIITYTNSGFQPANLSVQSGSKVTIKNISSRPLQFDSDPHPQHTEDPELNVGLVPAGQSVTITVTAKGSHGYHNHLSAGDTGTLIVE
jgi:plastocyanin